MWCAPHNCCCSPQSFDLDSADLDARFKSLQRAVHPDLFGTRSKHEQALSTSASSSVNIAYRILREPSTRAQYLLTLHGVDAIGETAGGGGGGRYVDAELLGEVMDAREALEDPTTPAAAIEEMGARNAAAVAECIAAMSAAFGAGDMPAAARATVALQYYTKLRYEIEERRGAAQHGRDGGGEG